MSNTYATVAELDVLCTWIAARIEAVDDSDNRDRCEADRRRLERHRPAEGGGRYEGRNIRICPHCSHDDFLSAVIAPCDDLLDLAHSHSITRDDWVCRVTLYPECSQQSSRQSTWRRRLRRGLVRSGTRTRAKTTSAKAISSRRERGVN